MLETPRSHFLYRIKRTLPATTQHSTGSSMAQHPSSGPDRIYESQRIASTTGPNEVL